MKIKAFLTLPLVMVLAACSSTIEPEVDYQQDYAFENIKSFAVVTDNEKPMDVVYHISDIDNDRIARALQSALMNKGLKEKEPAQADIHAVYQIVTKDKTRVRSYGTTVGYRCFRCRGAFIGGGMGNNVDVRNYTEGTIIIDMLDPETKKSVWRSVVSKPVKKNMSVEEKDRVVFEGIEAMLANFLVVAPQ